MATATSSIIRKPQGRLAPKYPARLAMRRDASRPCRSFSPDVAPIRHEVRTAGHGEFKDAEERERLLLEHLPQVRFIARRIHNHLPAQVPMDDLIHSGVLGLIDAVEKFDPSKNVQLRSYAKFRIRGAILDSLREMDWGPRQLRRQARKVEDARRELKVRLGRAATETELAGELDMKLKDFQRLLSDLCGLDLGSLPAEPVDSQLEKMSTNKQSDGAVRGPFSECFRREMQSLISLALSHLDEKGRRVVTLYYLEELTMKEVGAALGLGESRISQIHSAAILRLRARMDNFLNSHIRTRANSGCKNSKIPACRA